VNVQEYNRLIKETYKIGEKLIFDKFCQDEMVDFQLRVSQIVDSGLKILSSKVQLKTCTILGTLTIESFRLTLLQQIFFSDGKGTYGKVNAKNTDEQIKKRYILNVNRFLSVLTVNE